MLEGTFNSAWMRSEQANELNLWQEKLRNGLAQTLQEREKGSNKPNENLGTKETKPPGNRQSNFTAGMIPLERPVSNQVDSEEKPASAIRA